MLTLKQAGKPNIFGGKGETDDDLDTVEISSAQSITDWRTRSVRIPIATSFHCQVR